MDFEGFGDFQILSEKEENFKSAAFHRTPGLRDQKTTPEVNAPSDSTEKKSKWYSRV